MSTEHKDDPVGAIILHVIGLAATIWTIFPSVWTIQHVASWHGYDWSFGVVCGYIVLYGVLTLAPSAITSADRIKELHQREFGRYQAALSNTGGLTMRALFVTVAWLIVRAM